MGAPPAERDAPQQPDARYQGSLEELRTHPLWSHITEIQQRWLVHYLEHRDHRAAAYASSTYNGNNSADMAGLRHLRNFRIRTLIEAYDGQLRPYDKPMTASELEWIITQRLRSGVAQESTFAALTTQLMELKNWRVLKKMRQAGKKATERAARDRATVLVYEAEKAREEEEESRFDPFAEVRRLEAERNSTS